MSVSMLGPVSTLERWREESLYLDFVSGDPIDERLTTVRASEAARWNEYGVLEFVPPNTPRIDYDPITKAIRGLLVEEARTNLFPESQEFSRNWGLPNSQIRPNAITAPDGTLSACEWTLTVAGTFPYIGRQVNVVSGQAYTQTIRVKKGTYNAIQLLFNATGFATTGGNPSVAVDLETGEVLPGSSVSVERWGFKKLPDDWCEVWASHTAVATTASYFQPFRIPSARPHTVGQSLYVWGAQLEQGAFPTSYIRTLPQFQSRASDAVYTDAQGVLRIAPPNTPRYSHGYVGGRWVPTGLIVEGQATNLLTCRKHNPINSDGINVSTTANTDLTIAVVTDTAELSASDLSAICTNGAVYRAAIPQGSAGGRGFLNFTGTTTGATPHVISLYARTQGVAGTRYGGQATSDAVLEQSSRYTRHINRNEPNAVRGMQLWLEPGATVYFILPQLEAGSVATSVIPGDTLSAVTRAADVAPSAAVTRAGDVPSMAAAGWYRTDEGTLVAEASTFNTGNSSFSRVAEIAEAAAKLGMSLQRNGTDARGFSGDGVNLQLSQRFPSNVVRRFALVVKRNDFALAAGTNDLATDNTAEIGSIAAGQRLTIGAAFAGNSQLNGHIRCIAYHPRRLSNDELKRLTTI